MELVCSIPRELGEGGQLQQQQGGTEGEDARLAATAHAGDLVDLVQAAQHTLASCGWFSTDCAQHMEKVTTAPLALLPERKEAHREDGAAGCRGGGLLGRGRQLWQGVGGVDGGLRAVLGARVHNPMPGFFSPALWEALPLLRTLTFALTTRDRDLLWGLPTCPPMAVPVPDIVQCFAAAPHAVSVKGLRVAGEGRKQSWSSSWGS